MSLRKVWIVGLTLCIIVLGASLILQRNILNTAKERWQISEIKRIELKEVYWEALNQHSVEKLEQKIKFRKLTERLDFWIASSHKYQGERNNLSFENKELEKDVIWHSNLQAENYRWAIKLEDENKELKFQLSEISGALIDLQQKLKEVKTLPVVPKLPEVIEIIKPSLEEVIKNTIGSVVHINNVDCGWQGSGVAIASDLILTARHVAEDSERFTITLEDGTIVYATRAISSKKHDLAFIKLDEPVLTPVELGSVQDCNLGQQVFCIGSPYGKMNFNSVTLGIVSGLNRDCDELNYESWEEMDYGWSVAFTTDAAGHPGNSGCPVFTMDGIVRGILVGGHSPVLIYCMPVDLVMDDTEEIELMFVQNYRLAA